MERDDDAEFVANLPDHVAPLTEMVGLPPSPRATRFACSTRRSSRHAASILTISLLRLQ